MKVINLKHYRILAGLTQDGVSKRVGMHRISIRE